MPRSTFAKAQRIVRNESGRACEVPLLGGAGVSSSLARKGAIQRERAQSAHKKEVLEWFNASTMTDCGCPEHGQAGRWVSRFQVRLSQSAPKVSLSWLRKVQNTPAASVLTSFLSRIASSNNFPVHVGGWRFEVGCWMFCRGRTFAKMKDFLWEQYGERLLLIGMGVDRG